MREVPVCEPEADELLEAARAATVRGAAHGMLAQAARGWTKNFCSSLLRLPIVV